MTSLAVVIPTRNRRFLLERAVNSVPPAVEVIVVDDGSTDETPILAPELVAGRGSYMRLDQPRGPCHARNVGATLASADLLLFLDDDDMLLSGGERVILELADSFGNDLLFLHNCSYPDGSTSIPATPSFHRLTYADWLVGSHAELKPVARRELFDVHRFEDTGASGEGLLWGKVIRDFGAVVGETPVVYYDTSGDGRLTSGRVRLSRAEANAGIAERWLEEFGTDIQRVKPERWRSDLRAAVFYNVVAGRRDRARGLVAAYRSRLTAADRALLHAITRVPASALRALFILWRGLAKGRA